jgi:O-antigen/teichoic acid export membrane protein
MTMFASIRHQLQLSGGQFIQRSFFLAAGFAIARFFGLCNLLLLGHVLSAEAYGYVQYSLLLAGIIGIGTQPLLQHTLARLVSVHRHDIERLNRIVMTTLTITGLLSLLALVLSTLFFALSGSYNQGALFVFVGLTTYYAYYGIARGFEDSTRLSMVFIASNIVQFIGFVAVYFVLGVRDTLPALMIYGLSYVGPVLYLSLTTPTPLHFEPTSVRRDTAKEVLRFTLPLWGSHALFAFGAAGDVFLLTALAGEAAAGAFVFNRTLCIIFDFLPMAVGTIIMPRIAAAGGGVRRLTLLSVGAVLAASMCIATVFLVVYPWLLDTFFSPSYRLPLLTVLLMIISQTLYGIHGILCNVAIGKNQAGVELIGRLIILVLLYGGGTLLIPMFGVQGAALTNVIVAAVVVVTFPLVTKLHSRLTRQA